MGGPQACGDRGRVAGGAHAEDRGAAREQPRRSVGAVVADRGQLPAGARGDPEAVPVGGVDGGLLVAVLEVAQVRLVLQDEGVVLHVRGELGTG
ncbi:hypothetical protein ACQ4WX_48175 [Streptomyces lasalocidi]